MAANEKGLFGVRGFGLYERFSNWVGNEDEEELDEQKLQDYSAGFGEFTPSGATVSVLARCRPLLRSRDASCSLSADEVPEGDRLRFEAPQVGLHEVCCTAYLGPDSTQEAVFEHAANIVERALHGSNGLVLCCGSGSTGKTYTMVGPADQAATPGDLSSEGLIPRAARLIFERMQSMDEVFVVEASFLDLLPADGAGATEQLVDLLSDKPGRLRVMQDPVRPDVFVCEGLSRQSVRRHEKVSEILKAGLKRREALEASGRRRGRKCHCVFTISLEGLGFAEGMAEPVVKRGKLVFVEYAGLPSPGLAYGSGGPSAYRSPSLELLLTDCVTSGSPVLLVANFAPEVESAEQSVRTLALAESVLLGTQLSEEQRGLDPPEASEEAPHGEEEESEPPPAEMEPEVDTEHDMGLRQDSVDEPEEEASAPVQPRSRQAAPLQQRSSAAQQRPVAAPTAASKAKWQPQQATGAAASALPRGAVAAAALAAGSAPSGKAAGPARLAKREAPQTPPRGAAPLSARGSSSAAPAAAAVASPPRRQEPEPQVLPPYTATAPPPEVPSMMGFGGSAELKLRSAGGAARVAELEDQLKETQAMKRAVEMEVAQLKAKVASTEERVKLLGEMAEEFSRDRNSHQDEHRSLRTKTDMQQQKLIMHEDELQKLRSEVNEKKAEVASLGAAFERDVASQSQERDGWRKAESELQQKAGKLKRELEEYRRKSSLDRLRTEKEVNEACMELRMRIQQLSEKASIENDQLEKAQQARASLEAEKRIQEQREEALRENGMRELARYNQELSDGRQREHELQNMLTELQDGLLSAEETAVAPDGGHPPMTIAGA